MKKIVNINLSGRVFNIDEDAFAHLRVYMDRLKDYFKNQEGGQEIIADIESRIAELLGERMVGKFGVINLRMVEEVIGMMGQPEDFDTEDSEKSDTGKTDYSSYHQHANKRLFRDIDSRVLGGVCSGIGAYFNIDAVWVRVIFALLIFFGLGTIIPIYIVLWIIVPAAVTTAQKLQMQGENITIDNIEKTIKNEFEDVKKQFSKARNSNVYKKGQSWWDKFNKRDKTTLLIVAIVGGMILLSNIFGAHPIHNNFLHTGFMNGLNFHVGHLPFFHFPGVAIIAVVLLLTGLLIRPAFKIILYVIAFIVLAVFGIKILSFVLGGAFMFW